MKIRVVETGAFFENCYIIWGSPDQAIVVDPGDDAALIMDDLRKNGLTPSAYFLTHGHIDHISALDGLLAAFPATVYLNREDAAWAFSNLNAIPPYLPLKKTPDVLDTDLHEGRLIEAGPLKARVICTPGHTPGGVCFAFDADAVLVSGDTLFSGSIGRTDFQGGSMRKMRDSLAALMELDDAYQVLPGHGEATTIGAERANNPYIAKLG